VAAFDGLTAIVNAAGIIATGSVEHTSDAAWDEMIDINLRAPFRLMRAAASHLIASKGSVVNVSSVTGLRAFPGVLAYCVSKAGVDQLTRCAALELAPHGVRVNAVSPGVIDTPFHTSFTPPDVMKSFLSAIPLGRIGTPVECATAIAFLASPAASFVVGETLEVNGGQLMR
jgi:NAD(P)-dependent dehydrogenase (short-subunit alcohol dehydrogenase family)